MSAAETQMRIGDRVTVERHSGAHDTGEIRTLRIVRDAVIAGVRFDDGSVEHVQVTQDDMTGLAAERPLALARAILDGRAVRLPLGRQLRILATAVMAAEGGAL